WVRQVRSIYGYVVQSGCAAPRLAAPPLNPPFFFASRKYSHGALGGCLEAGMLQVAIKIEQLAVDGFICAVRHRTALVVKQFGMQASCQVPAHARHAAESLLIGRAV